jgi:poly(hydroxyalkanoate) granule-associated protein
MSKSNKSEAESSLKSMANKIVESGQQIWLAGLGAFSKAQEEGTKLYDALVKEGSALEKITTKYTSNKVEEVRGAVESTVSQVKDRASDTWDKLEKVFEERVGRALGALGIPNREELTELSKRVDDLSKSVKTPGKPVAKAASKPAPKIVPKAAPKAPAKAAPKKAIAKAAEKPAAKVVTKVVKAASKTANNNLAKASKAAKRAMSAVSTAVAKAAK